MDTTYPILLFNHQAKNLLEQTNETMKKVILLLVFALFYNGISAQSAGQSIVVNEARSYIASHRNQSQFVNQSESLSAQNLEMLITKVQPSIYVEANVVKTYGEKPKNLFTDLSSLNQLSSSVILKNNIEIVIIRIHNSDDLKSTIDLSLFSNFKNLKYIYVVSSVTTTNQAIAQMIVNNDDKYSIYYKIEKGDNNQ